MTGPSIAAPFRAACVQMRSGKTPARNIDAAVALVREAAGLGATYVQTPEMTNAVIGNRSELMEIVRQEEVDATLAAFQTLARELRIHLHAGSLVILRPDGKVANRAFLIGPDGAVSARYDKVHLFDVDLPNGERWRESATYTGGETAVVVDLPAIRLGLSICYDVRFPYLYRALAEAGAALVSAPACFTKQTGEAHWTVLQRARAIENGAFMVSAAQAGHHEDGRDTFGHSIIVDPWGRVLAEADDRPGVIVAEIDPALALDARGRIPTLQHTRDVPVTLAGGASLARSA